MKGPFFVPARNIHHRHAALALYRALLRTAHRVELPADLKPREKKLPRLVPKPHVRNVEESDKIHAHPAQRLNHWHPIGKQVRKRFLADRNYTSLRLVYASMATGYKFLSMLSKAASSNSKEYAELVAFMRDLASQRASQRARDNQRTEATAPDIAATQITPGQATERSDSPAKEVFEPRGPLLAITSGPGEPPSYLGTPRPVETLGRDRRVPQFVTDSYGVPFLRYSKPHDPKLDRMNGQRRKMWLATMEKFKASTDTLVPDFSLEDVWEHHLANAAHKEGAEIADSEPMSWIESSGAQGPLETTDNSPGPRSLGNAKDTYMWTALKTSLWYEYRLERVYEDFVARAEALVNLRGEERRLAALEKGEDTNPSIQAVQQSINDHHQQGGQGGQIKVKSKSIRTCVEAAREGEAKFGQSTGADRFDTPAWRNVVAQHGSKMLDLLMRHKHPDVRF
ncbi:uncharacterized protein J7T54_005630 [Emericellopsis cladophorae]|uniref:Uncharacterized protein n=1 Tax=Emericellopsis cladophorae TaxID=2686198 RepID=A0A9P9Y548_9HYPO|nr:uncharacterized protein J7T54_005630 [Emericellopsis cladophorae]KAI6783601.1 hypothetical protein J7T54_005630 [Emericellopsis cladophorae]